MRHIRSYLMPALVLVLPLVAACGDEDDDDDNAMSQGDDAPADGMASTDAPAVDAPGDDDAADDVGGEQASDDDALGDPAGPSAAPANPTPATPVASGAVDDLIADVCAREAECTGEPTEGCVAEGEAVTGLIAVLCPDLVVPWLECAAEAPTCDPEVDCVQEQMALQNCGLEPVVDEATIQMACEVYASCEGQDVATCVEEFAAAGGGLELLCPGAFTPYIECIAAMTGCEPEVECAEEMAVLEDCGLSMSAGMMP